MRIFRKWRLLRAERKLAGLKKELEFWRNVNLTSDLNSAQSCRFISLLHVIGETEELISQLEP